MVEVVVVVEVELKMPGHNLALTATRLHALWTTEACLCLVVDELSSISLSLSPPRQHIRNSA